MSAEIAYYTKSQNRDGKTTYTPESSVMTARAKLAALPRDAFVKLVAILPEGREVLITDSRRVRHV